MVWVIKKVELHGDIAIVTLSGGTSYRYKIKIDPHVKNVGSWYRTRGKTIRIDDDIANNKSNLKSIIAHEAVEEHVARLMSRSIPVKKRHALAHTIAQNSERAYHLREFGKKSWHNLTYQVNKVYHKERRR